MSKLLKLSAVILLIAVYVNSSLAVKSNIKTPEKSMGSGCTCSGTEVSGGGSGPRIFKLKCVKGGQSKTCSYRGNPHICSSYNNNGQQTFYNQLRDEIGPEMCGNLGTCPSSTAGYSAKICKKNTQKGMDARFYLN